MRESPPIPFYSKSKKEDSDLAEADKTNFIKFDFFFLCQSQELL
jgi:hypothetical protein